MKPYYEQDGITIFHSDCRDVLPTLGPVDLVLTDPPYGVDLGKRPRGGRMAKHGDDGYTLIDDSPEFIDEVAVPVINECREIATRVVLTCGVVNLFRYPTPDAVWCIYQPNGAGRGPWGAFTCWQPVLCYGKPPAKPGSLPNAFLSFEQAEANGHPCPKPLLLWRKVLLRASCDGETVVDPFMGSGTTLRAAKDLGRKAIGIEIEERYVEIAIKRLAQQVLPFEEAS